MSEKMPSLTVYRPVINIEEHHIAAIQKELAKLEQLGLRDIHKSFVPPANLKASLLKPNDLLQFYYSLERSLNEPARDKLIDAIFNELPETATESVTVPNAGKDVHNYTLKRGNRASKGVLMVGDASVLSGERAAIKSSIQDFEHDSTLPTTGMWVKNEPIGVVQIANADNLARKKVLMYASALLSRLDILPDPIKLGAVVIDPVN